MYKVNIECATEEIALAIQDYVNRYYNDKEVYWNAITKAEKK